MVSDFFKFVLDDIVKTFKQWHDKLNWLLFCKANIIEIVHHRLLWWIAQSSKKKDSREKERGDIERERRE